MSIRKTSFVLVATMLLGTASTVSLARHQEGPNDAQIVGIVIVADKLDIAYGKIALSKSKNKNVREFANRMVTDHSAVQKSVIALAKKLGVKSETSPTAEALEKGGKDITAKLKSLKGKAFDKFYVDNEVSYHRVVNNAVAKVLIPSAKNAELKAALEGAAPLFLAHQKHAEMVQAGGKMGKMDKMGGGK